MRTEIDFRQLLKNALNHIGCSNGYGYTFDDLMTDGLCEYPVASPEYSLLKELCDELIEEDEARYPHYSPPASIEGGEIKVIL